MAISEFRNFEIFKKYKNISWKKYILEFSPLKPFFEKNGLYVIEPVQVSFGRKFQLNTYKNGRVMHLLHFIV